MLLAFLSGILGKYNLLNISTKDLGTVVHTFIFSSSETESGRGQSESAGLHSEFHASQNYVERPCLKGKTERKEKDLMDHLPVLIHCFALEK